VTGRVLKIARRIREVGVTGSPVSGRRGGHSQHYCGSLDCELPLEAFWQNVHALLALCLVVVVVIVVYTYCRRNVAFDMLLCAGDKGELGNVAWQSKQNGHKQLVPICWLGFLQRAAMLGLQVLY